jgi:uncharacterized RDD family membrane protein YckC
MSNASWFRSPRSIKDVAQSNARASRGRAWRGSTLFVVLGQKLRYFRGVALPEQYSSVRLAPFWARGLAGVLDFALVFIVLSVPEAFLPDFSAVSLQIALSVVELCVLWGYFIVGYSRYQTTFGKRLFRLRVVSDSSLARLPLWRCVVRAIAFPFSLVMGVGLLMALFNPRRQTFHDMLAGSRVIQTPRS